MDFSVFFRLLFDGIGADRAWEILGIIRYS